MKVLNAIRCLGAAGLIAGVSMPAHAQVGDFLCSTLSIGCPPPPPPPPPPVAAEPPVEAPVKKVRKRKAKRTAAKKAAAKKDAAETQ